MVPLWDSRLIPSQRTDRAFRRRWHRGGRRLIGTALATQITQRVRSQVIVIGLFWIETVLLMPLVLTRNPYLLGAIVALAAVFAPAWNGVIVGARLKLTPDHLRGRVISAARFISGSLLALGPLVAGLLSQSLGTTDTLLLLAAWQLLVALTATGTKALRSGLMLTGSSALGSVTEVPPTAQSSQTERAVRPAASDQ